MRSLRFYIQLSFDGTGKRTGSKGSEIGFPDEDGLLGG